MSNNFVNGSATLINELIIWLRRMRSETMWNRCVQEWLKELRYETESYDDFSMAGRINFGKICRVSVNFGDSVEKLQIVPVVYEWLEPEDLAEDVLQWRRELRFQCCDEEEVLDDLFSDLGTGPKDESFSKAPNFPVPEEEEDVPIRPSRSSVKLPRPKTYSSTITKKKEESLDIRGLKGLEILKEKCVKINSNETLRLVDKQLQLLDDKGIKDIIKFNIRMKKGVKVISKKELEMTDIDKTIYRLHFTSTKDAKLFIEIEKSHHTLPPIKPMGGPFWQLRKLLKKRSSIEILEMKGIIKNEPIFGNTLEALVDEQHPVPEVITRIIELIEEPENITSVGLYRASANLAVVQNIRCEINCGRWEILEKHRTDVDVLAGTLKLFFRELKQPLISCEVCEELREAITEGKTSIGTIVENLPAPNRATFIFIIRHLLKVCEHKDENKMDLYNIAICWGPTLITLPTSCSDLVAQTTQFTKVTEHVLQYYKENLTQLVDIFIPKSRDFVYQVIKKLTELIENKIETEGIYRKSGSNTKIDKIMKLLEKQNLTEIDPKSDVHDLCCALKKYLASLKDPLIPEDFFFDYCKICDKFEDSPLRYEIRQMVDKIHRKDAILLLFDHLNKVVCHSRKNKMPAIVLYGIWMTTLIPASAGQDMKKKVQKLFGILLNLNREVLPDLVEETRIRESRYDNVPDDIHDDNTSREQMFTKL